ncbi:hypothetical protein FZ934_24845 (plasmid) [Rhizobium grahamii]|uniref:Integrase n=1 Tax=Rhizobium grahamii TaxID=1120045 RepID=A0A5Q0CH36_9HYPH|nr:hypothetical protein [Rhizobium grahamii]QFY63481.1 hypothetical protein FZ934_24845 [Rhizobium grahamii]
MKTNAFRHFLNTLAQRGGLSEYEIAAWSGRVDLNQNRAYDHRSPAELIHKVKRLQRNNGTAALRSEQRAPVSKLQVPKRFHGHATEIGYCEHDFSGAPCTMFMDCLHCTEHLCIKGFDPSHKARVDDALALAELSLEQAKHGAIFEEFGADDWVNSHQETIDRLSQLKAILEDDTIPDGAVIRLSKSGRYSLVEQAVRDHEAATGNIIVPPDAFDLRVRLKD